MDRYHNLMIKSSDVYTLIESMNGIGWSHIRESSINRILYISAVVYTFRFPDKKNIYIDSYNFIITLSGPEDADIPGVLTNLLSNEKINCDDKGYYITNEKKEMGYDKLEFFKEKKDWIEDMAYIIGIYGEDRIYDFIFRDPEYKTSLKSNSILSLDIKKTNETVKTLNKFKKSFETVLDKDKNIKKLQNRKYLELYFEYVFGTILRGE